MIELEITAKSLYKNLLNFNFFYFTQCITVLTGLAGTGYKLDSSLSARISVLFPTLVKWSSPTKDSNGLQIDADIQSLQLLTLAEFKK